MPVSLAQSLIDANAASRKFIVELDEADELVGPGDPGLAISRKVTQALIGATDKALASGDVVAMVQAAQAHGIGS